MGEKFSYLGKIERNEINWTTNGDLKQKDTSIDFVIETTHPSFIYEGKCFETVSSRFDENHYAVGPHMVDFILTQSKLASYPRPDGMIFTRDKKHWTLTGLLEVKMGSGNGIHRKLKGFSDLLRDFRADPAFLSTSLRQTIGRAYPVPEVIKIPQDDQVEVILACPQNIYIQTYNQLFPMTCIKIPA
jgi:hypothetical protein